MLLQLQRRNSVVVRTALFGALGIIAVFTGAYRVHASPVVGTISGYAFSNVGGYVNFGTTNGAAQVTDGSLSGYAWSANDGWITLAPTQSGVRNNGTGTLSGFAWDQTAGWIDFTGVTIDSDGRFRGTATGGTVNGASYAINFDCTNCNVRTDWRPAVSRPAYNSGSGGGFLLPGTTIVTPPVTEPPPGSLPPTSLPQIPPPGAPSTPVKTSFYEWAKAAVRGVIPKSSIPVPTATTSRTVATSSTPRGTLSKTPAPTTSSIVSIIGSVIQSIVAGFSAFFHLFVKF